jgi:hypothetical protein
LLVSAAIFLAIGLFLAIALSIFLAILLAVCEPVGLTVLPAVLLPYLSLRHLSERGGVGRRCGRHQSEKANDQTSRGSCVHRFSSST